MRTFWIAVILLLCAGVVASQTSTTTSSLTIPATAVAANCPVPVVGTTNYCFAADKLQVSPSGGAYVVIWPSSAVAGVISLSVNGKPPMTGAVNITVPTQAVIPAQNAPLQ